MKAQTIILTVIVGLFLLLNIISSQTVSGLFSDLSTGKKEASVEFLKRIKDQKYFSRFYSEISGYYQENLEESVYSESLQRQRKIDELQEILDLNPKARDALYSLYILYLQEGDAVTADGYLKRAQEIDPEIK